MKKHHLGTKYSRRTQGGAALILVLLLVAVISVMAVTAGEKTHQLQLRLAMQNQQQSILREQAVLIPSVLERYFDAIQNSSNSHPKLTWQQPIAAPINDGLFTTQLMQQPPCFNINSLAGMQLNQLPDSTLLRQMMALLENLKIPNTNRALEQILDAQRHASRQLGDPIAAKNKLQSSLEWPQDQWSHASPFLCFLPSKDNRWNINGFGKQQKVLLDALLLNQLIDSELNALIETADNDGFENNHSMWQHESLKNKDIPSRLKLQLRLKSEYYWLNIKITRRLSEHRQWLFLQHQNNALKELYSYRM